MPKHLVLHVGAMKTGTSFLQAALQDRTEALAAESVSFLGDKFVRQSRAVSGMLARDESQDTDAWRRLARRARKQDEQTSIVSMEFLSFADADQAAEMVSYFKRTEVTVVLTVRDQLSTIPAQWQTFARNRGAADWPEYLRHIRRTGPLKRRSHARHTFRRAQDVPRIIKAWEGVGDLVVVTVPPSSAPRTELWDRFCEAARIPAVPLDVDRLRANESLGYASCEALVGLNPRLKDLTGAQYRKGVRPLARDALSPLRGEGGRPVLDRAAAEFALGRNERFREVLATQRVIGSLEDLPVTTDLSARPEQAPAAAPADVLAAAQAMWRHLEPADAPAPADLGAVLDGVASRVRAVAGGQQ